MSPSSSTDSTAISAGSRVASQPRPAGVVRGPADRRPVVVLTELCDPTADLVIEELYRRGVPVLRFDPADFPQQVVLSAGLNNTGLHGTLATPTRTADLSGVRSLYYRRPRRFDFSHLEPQAARFATAQARFGLGGVLANLPGCRYVNHPHSISDAEYKPAQLVTAAELGMRIPHSIITNDPEAAREFAHECGRLVYKPLYSTTYQADGEFQAVWVREVNATDLIEHDKPIDQPTDPSDNEAAGSIAGTAHLFQQRIDKVADLRITVVGDELFCVRIDIEQERARRVHPDQLLLDWRYDYDQLRYSVIEPPPGLADQLTAYLKHFRLAFGCFDFALTHDHEPVFLECNPNGQWAWIEQTKLPITAALADLLQQGIQWTQGIR
jgi:ATP-grasp ribosomal peptide maturase